MVRCSKAIRSTQGWSWSRPCVDRLAFSLLQVSTAARAGATEGHPICPCPSPGGGSPDMEVTTRKAASTYPPGVPGPGQRVAASDWQRALRTPEPGWGEPVSPKVPPSPGRRCDKRTVIRVSATLPATFRDVEKVTGAWRRCGVMLRRPPRGTIASGPADGLCGEKCFDLGLTCSDHRVYPV